MPFCMLCCAISTLSKICFRLSSVGRPFACVPTASVPAFSTASGAALERVRQTTSIKTDQPQRLVERTRLSAEGHSDSTGIMMIISPGRSITLDWCNAVEGEVRGVPTHPAAQRA